MRTENTESSFSVFSVCILPWPALSVVASNFGIEVYLGRSEAFLVVQNVKGTLIARIPQTRHRQQRLADVRVCLDWTVCEICGVLFVLSWIPKLDWFIRLNRLDSVDL